MACKQKQKCQQRKITMYMSMYASSYCTCTVMYIGVQVMHYITVQGIIIL